MNAPRIGAFILLNPSLQGKSLLLLVKNTSNGYSWNDGIKNTAISFKKSGPPSGDHATNSLFLPVKNQRQHYLRITNSRTYAHVIKINPYVFKIVERLFLIRIRFMIILF